MVGGSQACELCRLGVDCRTFGDGEVKLHRYQFVRVIHIDGNCDVGSGQSRQLWDIELIDVLCVREANAHEQSHRI